MKIYRLGLRANLDSELDYSIYIPSFPTSLETVTLLPPLKFIRPFKSIELPKLITAAPQPAVEPVEVDPTPVVQTPSDILRQIGIGLRQWREHYGISIEDMSAKTQIQPRSIEAIEQGNIAILPELVYVRKMVKRYADHLGLDGSAIARNIPAWENTAAPVKPSAKPKTAFTTAAPLVKPAHVYLGYTLLIIVGGAGISHLLNDAFKPKMIPTPQVAIIQPKVATAKTQKVTALPDVTVDLAVTSPAWAQIGIDGTTKFTGNLSVGTKLSWVGTKQITISTNNAGGLMLSRDRQPPQPVGKPGEKQQITIKLGK